MHRNFARGCHNFNSLSGFKDSTCKMHKNLIILISLFDNFLSRFIYFSSSREKILCQIN